MTFHTHKLSWGLILILPTVFLVFFFLKRAWLAVFPASFSISSHYQHTTSAVFQLKHVYSFIPRSTVLGSFFFETDLTSHTHTHTPLRGIMELARSEDIHCALWCIMLHASNQILCINWTMAANRFFSELKGFLPWILIANPQAEFGTIKFPQAFSWMFGRGHFYYKSNWPFQRRGKTVERGRKEYDKRSGILKDMKL